MKQFKSPHKSTCAIFAAMNNDRIFQQWNIFKTEFSRAVELKKKESRENGI